MRGRRAFRCGTEEPLIENKGGGTEAACHFPLTEEEVSEQLPATLVGSS